MVSRKEGGESEGEERNSPILRDPERNVGLAVVHHEEVDAGGFHREGVSTAAGGGTLEGPWEGGVPATSSR